MMKPKTVHTLIKRHTTHRQKCHQVAAKYLSKGDYAEASRWADAAKSHRFVTEVLKELNDDRVNRR